MPDDPAADAPPPSPWTWRRRRWLLPMGVCLLLLPLVVAGFVNVPYYLISPGEARGVEDLIEVKGVPVFEPEGTVLFTTVALTGSVNIYEALVGWLDDDVEVVPERDITGGAPRKTVRQLNIQAMDDSKLTATKVALERLNYRVTAKGDGALVIQVVQGDPADGHLEPGDVITAVDGEPITLHDQVVTRIRQHKAGETVEIRFRRGDEERTERLPTVDAGEGQARIGAALQTKDLRYDFPFAVSIETGVVGGPSAGLAFTLALLDDLTPGELTGGRKVAVTGTIDSRGQVGVVGGVAQKTVTARRAGAFAFLVPPEEVKEAKIHAGKMRIIGVQTLDDALSALQGLGGSGLAMPPANRS
jgi:PDZ domain-containing protein